MATPNIAKKATSIHPFIVFVVLLLLIAPSAFLQGKNLPMWLIGTMTTMVLIAFVWTKIALRGLQVTRLISAPAKHGEPYIVRYEVHNSSRWFTCFSLWIDEQSKDSTWQTCFRKTRGWIMEVGAGESVQGEAVFWPTHRGEVTFTRICITTSFPFGVFRSKKIVRQKTTVLVYPEVLKLRPEVLQSVASSGLHGQRSSRHGQGSEDYYGLRELVSGDRLGDIAWKASARRGELVCVQRSRPSPPRIHFILDLSTPTELLQCDKDARSMEEAAISLCASLLVESVRQEQEIALVVLGFPMLETAGFHSGQRQLSRLLASLSRIHLDANRSKLHFGTESKKNVGQAVIRPDSVRTNHALRDVKYFSGEQLAELQVRAKRSESA